MTKTVAIQGDQASFHDIAAKRLFGDVGRVYCDTFARTFEAVTEGKADAALCAIENSLYGSINEVYDLLLAHQLKITGEVFLRIEQCLIGLPGTKVDNIKKVYSHPVALAQCAAYLDTTLAQAEREEYHDTAASVAFVKELGDPTIAAIASREAAELHGLSILAASIETNKENYTRFVALSKAVQPGPTNKTSLVVELGKAPGSLYAFLGVFAKRSIALSKLQSRPIVGKAWHYIFYVDLEVGDNNAFKEALAELESLDCTLTVLGSYKAGESANL